MASEKIGNSSLSDADEETSCVIGYDEGKFTAETAQLWHIFYYYVYPIPLVLGIIGNSLCLLVFSRQLYSTPTYVYFKCLAASDQLLTIALGCALYVVPEMGHDRDHVIREYARAVYAAYVRVPLGATFLCCSALLVLTITVDRYIAICHPFQYSSWSSKKRAWIISALCLLISIMLSAPSTLQYTIVSARSVTDTQCYFAVHRNNDIHDYSFPYRYIYKPVGLVFLVTIEVAIIVISGITIRSYHRAANNHRHPHRRHVLSLMIYVVVVNVIVVVTATASGILTREGRKKHYEQLGMYSRALEGLPLFNVSFNSALNFYVFSIGSSIFRRELWMAVSCCCHRD